MHNAYQDAPENMPGERVLITNSLFSILPAGGEVPPATLFFLLPGFCGTAKKIRFPETHRKNGDRNDHAEMTTESYPPDREEAHRGSCP